MMLQNYFTGSKRVLGGCEKTVKSSIEMQVFLCIFFSKMWKFEKISQVPSRTSQWFLKHVSWSCGHSDDASTQVANGEIQGCEWSQVGRWCQWWSRLLFIHAIHCLVLNWHQYCLAIYWQRLLLATVTWWNIEMTALSSRGLWVRLSISEHPHLRMECWSRENKVQGMSKYCDDHKGHPFIGDKFS